MREHVGPRDFFDTLRTYARMHTRGRAAGHPAAEPFIGESFHPDGGFWLTRELMFRHHHGDKRRGDHYFHSSYCDLVLSGLVGISIQLEPISLAHAPPSDSAAALSPAPAPRPRAATLSVEPLFLPEQLSYFAAAGVRLRDKAVEVLYDRDGSHYGGAPGLAVWLDGELVARSPRLERLAVPGVLLDVE